MNQLHFKARTRAKTPEEFEAEEEEVESTGATTDPLAEASKTVRHVRSIYIENFVASVENDKIKTYRVNAKISFDLESERLSQQKATSSTQRRR